MNKITSKYGIIAVEAACAASHGVDPLTAWKVSAAKIFADSPSRSNGVRVNLNSFPVSIVFFAL